MSVGHDTADKNSDVGRFLTSQEKETVSVSQSLSLCTYCLGFSLESGLEKCRRDTQRVVS